MGVLLRITFLWDTTQSNIPKEHSPQHKSLLYTKIHPVGHGERMLFPSESPIG